MDLNKPLFIITGPSAVGKTAVVTGILQSNIPVDKVITTTSRVPRAGEIDGVNYHFVSQEQFETLVRDDKMFEWAEYAGNFYGSQRADVEKIFEHNQYPLWVLDSQGADFLKDHYKNTYVIFLVPSAFDILRTRMEKRGMAEADIRRRLKIARSELDQAPKYDVRVINYDGQLSKIVAEGAEIIRGKIEG